MRTPWNLAAAALVLMAFDASSAIPAVRGDDNVTRTTAPASAPTALAGLDQASQEWLNSEGATAFGRWLSRQLEADPNHPEWMAMLADILQGSQLGPTDGWFKKAVAQTRFPWPVVKQRYDRNHDDRVEPDEFSGSRADFARLDRNRDGALTAADLDWSSHALTPSPGSALFAAADHDGNGKVTRDEFLAVFDRIDQDKFGFLSQDELRQLFGDPSAVGGNRERRAEGPTKAILVKGLFQQEIGSLQPGPALNDLAPDFTLRTASGDQTVTLSKRIGPRPVALVFGNITCGPFRSRAGDVEKVYQRYKDRVDFLMIYVREAHPTDGWHMTSNDRHKVIFPQPKNDEERVKVAQTCQKLLDFDMTFLVDSIGDQVGATYSGMPSRLYLIDQSGRVAYKSGRGPFGFKPGELEQAILLLLADNAATRPAAR